MPIYVYLMPIFLGFFLYEVWWFRSKSGTTYPWPSAICSIALFGASATVDLLHGPVSLGVYARIGPYRS